MRLLLGNAPCGGRHNLIGSLACIVKQARRFLGRLLLLPAHDGARLLLSRRQTLVKLLLCLLRLLERLLCLGQLSLYAGAAGLQVVADWPVEQHAQQKIENGDVDDVNDDVKRIKLHPISPPVVAFPDKLRSAGLSPG